MTENTIDYSVLWVPRYWPAVGGTEFHTRQLAHSLSEHHRVSVVTHCNITARHYSLTQEAALTRSQTMPDVNTTIELVGPNARYRDMLFSLGKLYNGQSSVRSLYQACFKRALKREITQRIGNTDLIHFVYNGLTDAASLAVEVCDGLNVPLVVTPNVLDTASERSAWNSRRLLKVYAQAQKVIALTGHEAEWLAAQGVQESKISVIPYGPILNPGVLSTNEQATADWASTQPYILFLGRMEAEKGYQLVFDAFKQIRSIYPDINLVYVTPNDAGVPEQFNLDKEQPKDSRVHFIVDPSQQLKTTIIKEALALCVPSSIESLGGVYIEAMSCGVPVVALDRPVIRCVIEHGREGLLVENTTESVCRGLTQLLDDPVLRATLGRNGKRRVEERYQWTGVAEQIRQVYQQAREKRSPLNISRGSRSAAK